MWIRDSENGARGFCTRISTDKSLEADQYALELSGILNLYKVAGENIEGAIISSVVPQITDTVARALRMFAGVEPLKLTQELPTGVGVNIDTPSELGADLLAGAIAAKALYPLPAIVIDMGTATKITAVDEQGTVQGLSLIHIYHAQPAAQVGNFPLTDAGKVAPVDENLALGGCLLAQDQLEERAFARAGMAQNEHEFAFFDGEIHVVERHDVLAFGVQPGEMCIRDRPNTTFSIMCSRGIMPPSGVRVSCILFTVPVVKEVVTVVNIADCAMPKRTSLPSILPMAWSRPISANAGLPWLSAQKHTLRPMTNRMPMAAKMLRPSRP